MGIVCPQGNAILCQRLLSVMGASTAFILVANVVETPGCSRSDEVSVGLTSKDDVGHGGLEIRFVASPCPSIVAKIGRRSGISRWLFIKRTVWCGLDVGWTGVGFTGIAAGFVQVVDLFHSQEDIGS